MIQLIEIEGRLCVKHEDIVDPVLKKFFGGPAVLIYEYPGGDHDSVKWPDPNTKHLRGALYDDREQGIIPDDPGVLLPDGTEFLIDEPYWKAGDVVTWRNPEDPGVGDVYGTLDVVEYTNDSKLNITINGRTIPVCESELLRGLRYPKPQTV